MTIEQKKRRKRKLRFKKIYIPLLVLAVLITVFVFGVYRVLDSYATNIVTTYMEEVVNHDKASIRDYISERFSRLEAVYTDLEKRTFTTDEEILAELALQSRVQVIEELFLLDDKGNLYSSRNFVVQKNDNPFLSYFATGRKMTVARYDSPNSTLSSYKEYMLYCMDLSDRPLQFAQDGPRFVGIVALRDIKYLEEKMRITSFDGRGYTSILTENGDFVISDDSISSKDNRDNCFELLEDRDIEGITLDEIRTKYKAGETFTFWYTDEDGERKFLLFSPLNIAGDGNDWAEGMEWNFLASIKESVYTEQFRQFVTLVAFLVGGPVFIFAIVFVLFRRSQKRLNELYSCVTDGVRSREYYNDKVVDESVTSFAVVDIDHLKWLNDTHGHTVGDDAIRGMAEVLVKQVGIVGEVCRFGGDEFVIAFHRRLSEREFALIIHDIVEDVRAIRMAKLPDFHMSLSIGAYYGEGIASELFVKADDLLYEAKKTRDCAVLNIEPHRSN